MQAQAVARRISGKLYVKINGTGPRIEACITPNQKVVANYG